MISRIKSTSACLYGGPFEVKISWNHTAGLRSPMYGFCHESHGSQVCVLPATNPQLYAATLYFLATGRIPSKVLPLRARHVLGAEDRPLVLLQPLHPLLELRGLFVVVERNDVRLLHLDFLDRRSACPAKTSRPSRHRRQRLASDVPTAHTETPSAAAPSPGRFSWSAPARRSSTRSCCPARSRRPTPECGRRPRSQRSRSTTYSRMRGSCLGRHSRSRRGSAPSANCGCRAAADAGGTSPGTDPSTNPAARKSGGCGAAWQTARNLSIRLRNPPGSCFQSRSWRKTRMVFMPRFSAQMQLQIDAVDIERLGLPHLQLIHRVRRNVVAANQPRLPRIPLVRLLLRPFYRTARSRLSSTSRKMSNK